MIANQIIRKTTKIINGINTHQKHINARIKYLTKIKQGQNVPLYELKKFLIGADLVADGDCNTLSIEKNGKKYTYDIQTDSTGGYDEYVDSGIYITPEELKEDSKITEVSITENYFGLPVMTIKLYNTSKSPKPISHIIIKANFAWFSCYETGEYIKLI